MLLLPFVLFACKKDQNKDLMNGDTTYVPTPYTIEYPLHFYSSIPIPVPPSYNPTTLEGIELGRKLYYEKKLSKAGPLEGMACASCHLQSQSFTSNLSPGNSIIPHFNIDWADRFLWNGGVEGDLEDVMLFEVNDFFQTDLSGIKNDPAYKESFKKAFGSEEITSTTTAYALAQFMRTMITGNSRFDNYTLEKKGLPTNGPFGLSPAEKRGLDLFMAETKGDCFHCHGSPTNPLWTDNKFRNIGLDANPDSGLAAITGNPLHFGEFKTPSLRNLVFTAPYMHDGRFETLEEVIDFYTGGVEFSSPNIDPIMFKERNLTPAEKDDLIAFLKTLTDSSFVNNPTFQDPNK